MLFYDLLAAICRYPLISENCRAGNAPVIRQHFKSKIEAHSLNELFRLYLHIIFKSFRIVLFKKIICVFVKVSLVHDRHKILVKSAARTSFYAVIICRDPHEIIAAIPSLVSCSVIIKFMKTLNADFLNALLSRSSVSKQYAAYHFHRERKVTRPVIIAL